MTARERILAILVCGLLLCGGVWWGFGKYRSALRLRNNEIIQLQQEQQRLVEQQLQGEYANRQMGEYIVRSLSSDLERAQSQYQQWLFDIVQENELAGARVDRGTTRLVDELYHQLTFNVQGQTDLPNLVGLLHAFYAEDKLHRIRDLSVRKGKTGIFTVDINVDAIALVAAPTEALERENPSWRIAGDLGEYQEPILNRNLFDPPNAAPQFTGEPQIEAYLGRETPSPLTFKDREGHALRYELVSGPKEIVTLDEKTGTVRVDGTEKQEFTILVRATDNGYPQRSSEQTLTVKIVDPPAPPVETPEMEFDDASQTVLTALVQGRDEWTAWLHARTRDQTLQLRVGDQFEIGSVKGKVVGVNATAVQIETDRSKFELKMDRSLREAAAGAVMTQADDAEPSAAAPSTADTDLPENATATETSSTEISAAESTTPETAAPETQ